MKIKFIKTEGRYMTPIKNIEVYDDNGNKLNSEILNITIHAKPSDIIRATCEFSVSEIEGGEFELLQIKQSEVTSIGDKSRKFALNV